jgi:hypothetical protein
MFSRQSANIDGGKFVRLPRRPPPTLRTIPGTHFCYSLSRSHGHSTAGRMRSNEKSNDLIGNRTRDLPACSVVPQSTTLRRALNKLSLVFGKKGLREILLKRAYDG